MENISNEPRDQVDAEFDPLQVLFKDVHELIFQHFEARDVLNSSLVSPAWFRATEMSNKCAEKLELMLLWCSNYSDFDRNLRSARKYQNVLMLSTSTTTTSLIRQLLVDKILKKVCLIKLKLSLAEFNQFIGFIEGKVEVLTIVLPSFNNLDVTDAKVSFKFPKLRELHLDSTCGRLLQDIADNCTRLKILRISFLERECEYEEIFEKILANNDHLEVLEISTGPQYRPGDNFLSADAIKPFRFKLKAFTLIDKASVEKPRTALFRNSLVPFLERQANSVERLRIEVYHMTAEEFQMISKLPKLTDIALNVCCCSFDWNQLQLNPSESIRKCYLGLAFQYCSNMLRVLLASMPNLTLLSLNNVTRFIFSAIAPHCGAVEELRMCKFDSGQDFSNPSYFPNIKLLYVHNFSCGNQLLLEKPREAQTSFEQLLVDLLKDYRYREVHPNPKNRMDYMRESSAFHKHFDRQYQTPTLK